MTKALDFLKKFWGYFAAAGVIFFGVVVLKRKFDDYDALIEKLQGAHDDQIKALNKIREEERAKYEENQKKYEARMAAIEAEYEKAKQDLDEEKRKKVEDMVKKYSNKPDVLAKKLSDLTGFQVVLPEE
jgi:Skp family chaperone for outer membrane proteins